MGIVRFGIPKDEALLLKDLLHLTTFVEGGTYKGETAKQMAPYFERVITIEKSNIMWNLAQKNLNSLPNVTALHGDTREFFPKILKEENNFLFWLDAHWSGGDTYGKQDECPLMEELKIIFQYPKNYAILIDDARYFLAPPPKPHNFKNWPSLKNIISMIPDPWDLLVYEDVIYIFPASISDAFKEHIQLKITKIAKKQNQFSLFSIKNKIRNLLNLNYSQL